MKYQVDVCHLTSVHPRFDTRIFIKEARSLCNAGFSVALIVADGKGNEFADGVEIIDVGKPRGRVDRVLNTTNVIMKKAKELDAGIYHLHDPELIHVGLCLKHVGKTVIFDAHEDVPKQILSKAYIGKASRWWVSKAFKQYEAWGCQKFDYVIAATPAIRDKFLQLDCHTTDVNNFPVVSELAIDKTCQVPERKDACYLGDISGNRGIREMVRAFENVRTGARLLLGGRTSDNSLDEVRDYAGWSRVSELGWLDRDGVQQVLRRSAAGLVTLHPTPSYVESLPVKMFEYMCSGVPVIASNFPLWRSIVEENECGICVDPLRPQEIAAAIDYLMLNPELVGRMGENGRRAVIDKFNWKTEERKLVDLYASLMPTWHPALSSN